MTTTTTTSAEVKPWQLEKGNYQILDAILEGSCVFKGLKIHGNNRHEVAVKRKHVRLFDEAKLAYKVTEEGCCCCWCWCCCCGGGGGGDGFFLCFLLVFVVILFIFDVVYTNVEVAVVVIFHGCQEKGKKF